MEMPAKWTASQKGKQGFQGDNTELKSTKRNIGIYTERTAVHHISLKHKCSFYPHSMKNMITFFWSTRETPDETYHLNKQEKN